MAENDQFPSPYVVEPTSAHTRTVIMLHGRGSNAQEFADEFLSAELSAQNTTLREHFTSFRWVFPSSRSIWDTIFQENISAWFEAPSLTNVLLRAESQVKGLKASVEYIQNVLDDEISLLENNSQNIIIGGISQGAATGLWVLFSDARVFGGFFGASCWLPFYKDVWEFLDIKQQKKDSGTINNAKVAKEAIKGVEASQNFVNSMMQSRYPVQITVAMQSRIFLGHGVDDAYVDIDLGKLARDILIKAGYAVQWEEYEGADQEGHWFKDPEEIDDIASFLRHFSHGQA